jgi:ferredoxin
MLDLDSLLRTPQKDTLIYCCGPEALLQAVEEHCSSWPDGSLHLERFSPKDIGDPVRTDSFEVELRDAGKTITVPPDRSVLEIVEEAGVFVASSCQEGTCGTCETRVLEGEVDHRDSLLSPSEQAANDVMFICVSRAKSARLVLDL